MKTIVFVILGLCSLVTFGQIPNQQLRKQLEQNPEDVSALFEAADFFKTENIDSLSKYVNLLTDLANKNNDQNLRNRALLRQVEGYLLFNRYAKADSLLNTVTLKDDADEMTVDYLLAKGKVHGSKQQNSEALQAFYAALDKNNEGQLNYLIPEIYVEIAATLRENNDVENCTKYYRFALEEAKKSGNIPLQVKVCTQMCKAYNGWLTLNLDSSVYYGELGMKIAQEADYEYGYVNMISMVAAPLIRKGELRRGLNMSREALAYADKYNLPSKTQYYLILNQGFAFEQLGIYDSALQIMKEAARFRPSSVDHFRLEYLIQKSQGRFKEALDAFVTYKSKTDSILKGRNETKLSSLQARYEANAREKEVASLRQTSALQQLQLSQQRYFLVGLAMIFILLAVGAVLIYRQRQLKQQQHLTALDLAEAKKRLELEQQYRASELKALRSQMNPHFVFNALNSIQEYIMSNERKLAGKYLGKFADLMRVYLQHSQVRTISLREEIEAINLYLELEKLRFEDSMSYSIGIQDEVDLEVAIPSLLMQPYVENAIKHGLLHKKENRELKITVKQDFDNQLLVYEITDNGVGRKRSQEINQMRNPDHQPFATQAIKSRIELLNLDRAEPITETIADFDSSEVEPGTRVTLKIPIGNNAFLEAQRDNSEIEM